MMSDAPNLELLQRQQKQILDEMGEFRDQLTVLTEAWRRIETALREARHD